MTKEAYELDKSTLVDQTIADFEAFSPDLRSDGLAGLYVKSLFSKMSSEVGSNPEAFEKKGADVFYSLAKDVLGPISVAYTDFALKISEGGVVFPARDATPYFVIANKLVKAAPADYPVAIDALTNPFLNRKLWGIDDELDEGEVLDLETPLAQKFFEKEIGFGSMLTFVEQGAWGSMADMIKRDYPEQSFQLMFFFSHLPKVIFGFTNQFGLEEKELETVSDTFEALPKRYLRPTNLRVVDGKVTVDLTGKEIQSPLIQAWSTAVLAGFRDAALDVLSGKKVDPKNELEKLLALSEKTGRTGEFTGILPFHTITWSEGEKWKANWPWGKIPPVGTKT